MKKIMILTAEKTGNGHRVAANAIEKQMQALGYAVKKVECFNTMGKMGVKMAESYIPMTTKRPWMWKIAHSFSQMFTGIVHWFIYNKSKKAMLKEIKEYNPDLIVTVHCMFTKAVSKLLKKNKLNIPFMVDVIDLVNPPKVWRDKSADISFVPTQRVKEEYIKLGFDENKLVVSGFPIRADIIMPTEPKKVVDKINVLMVNPSVNIKKTLKFVKEVARIENANIKVVCGLDKNMFEVLTKEKEQNKSLKNVEILGFVKNMHELLAECHVLLTKAGPNMLLEGVLSGSAVVLTGHIPGQEAKNHEHVTLNGFGEQCENPNKIYEVLTNMINSGNIEKYSANAIKSEKNDGAIIIAEHIVKFLENKNK